MPKIYVNREFTLQLGGEKRHFAVGNHSVDAETGKHWYVQAHIGDEPAVDPDTSAVADALLADLTAKERELLQRAEDLDAVAALLEKKEADIQARGAAIGDREAGAAERDHSLSKRQADLDAREQALADREQAAQNAQSTPKDDGKASGKSTSK